MRIRIYCEKTYYKQEQAQSAELILYLIGCYDSVVYTSACAEWHFFHGFAAHVFEGAEQIRIIFVI